MSGAESPCARHGCSACCHDTEMPLTEEDAARLEALGHARADFSRVEGGVLTLRTDPTRATEAGAPCFFLEGGRCSVYADRPTGCRIYPFVLNEQRRMVRDEDCPHRAEFKPDPALQRRLLRVIAVIERETRGRA
jgi:Fe-S-cluster containining protein